MYRSKSGVTEYWVRSNRAIEYGFRVSRYSRVFILRKESQILMCPRRTYEVQDFRREIALSTVVAVCQTHRLVDSCLRRNAEKSLNGELLGFEAFFVLQTIFIVAAKGFERWEDLLDFLQPRPIEVLELSAYVRIVPPSPGRHQPPVRDAAVFD